MCCYGNSFAVHQWLNTLELLFCELHIIHAQKQWLGKQNIFCRVFMFFCFSCFVGVFLVFFGKHKPFYILFIILHKCSPLTDKKTMNLLYKDVSVKSVTVNRGVWEKWGGRRQMSYPWESLLAPGCRGDGTCYVTMLPWHVLPWRCGLDHTHQLDVLEVFKSTASPLDCRRVWMIHKCDVCTRNLLHGALFIQNHF